MVRYIIRRLIYMLLLLVLLSISVFAIIQLPAGDFIDHYIVYIELFGYRLTDLEIEQLETSRSMSDTSVPRSPRDPKKRRNLRSLMPGWRRASFRQLRNQRPRSNRH